MEGNGRADAFKRPFKSGHNRTFLLYSGTLKIMINHKDYISVILHCRLQKVYIMKVP